MMEKYEFDHLEITSVAINENKNIVSAVYYPQHNIRKDGFINFLKTR